MEQPQNINESPLETLRKRLIDAGVDVSQWGTGEAKTLEHLYEEIQDGETVLTVDTEGKLLRKLTASGANVFYASPDGKSFRLKEQKQVFKDGRERVRNFDWAVSEKIKANEDPQEGMLRGLREELGLEGEIHIEKAKTEERLMTRGAQSYPGLQSHYTSHIFKVILNDSQFKPEGYTEEQGDKTTYFIWEEVK